MGFEISVPYDEGFIQLMNCALDNLTIRQSACSFENLIVNRCCQFSRWSARLKSVHENNYTTRPKSLNVVFLVPTTN